MLLLPKYCHKGVNFCCFDIMLAKSLIRVESTVTETFFNFISICLHLNSSWAHFKRSFCTLSNNLLPCVLDIGALRFAGLFRFAFDLFWLYFTVFWNFTQNWHIPQSPLIRRQTSLVCSGFYCFICLFLFNRYYWSFNLIFFIG